MGADSEVRATAGWEACGTRRAPHPSSAWVGTTIADAASPAHSPELFPPKQSLDGPPPAFSAEPYRRLPSAFARDSLRG